MFLTDVWLFTGRVLFPRYRWTQGMVVGAKESEGEARHTGVGVQRFGAADTRFVFWRIRRGKERLVWSKRGVSSLFHQKGKRLPRGAVEI